MQVAGRGGLRFLSPLVVPVLCLEMPATAISKMVGSDPVRSSPVVNAEYQRQRQPPSLLVGMVSWFRVGWAQDVAQAASTASLQASPASVG